MAAKTKESFLSSGTMTALVICLLGLAAFILLFVWPDYRAIERQEGAIADLKHTIEVQGVLAPVYKDLSEKARFEVPALPFPEKKPLARGEIGRLSDVFRGLAEQNGLTFTALTPRFETMPEGGGALEMEVVVAGDFFDLRKFMLALGELPYVERAEQVRVSGAETVKSMDLMLWLAVE
jgi:hypothetical protein